MPAKRLYHNNAYMSEFNCNVISCSEPLNRKEYSIPVYFVTTDVTCFYPNSGGQPADRGHLSGVDVIDVIEEDDEIYHVTTSNVHLGPATGKIDWDRRFDHMQQHTGQHVLSASFMKLFDLETVGFHLGEEVVTIDINSSELTLDECASVERVACDTVFLNLAVNSKVFSQEEALKLPTRKKIEVSGDVRIVEIGNFDMSNCCGTHVKSTGEIGLIKIISTEKIRGMTRVVFLCGRRALKDYSVRNLVLSEASNMLSISYLDIVASITKMQTSYRELKKRNDDITSQLLEAKAEAIYNSTEPDINTNIRMICRVYDNIVFDSLKVASQKLCQKPKCVVLFCTKADDSAQFVFQRSLDINLDMNSILKDTMTLAGGKGGGSSIVSQGGIKDIALVDLAMSFAFNKAKSHLAL